MSIASSASSADPHRWRNSLGFNNCSTKITTHIPIMGTDGELTLEPRHNGDCDVPDKRVTWNFSVGDACTRFRARGAVDRP